MDNRSIAEKISSMTDEQFYRLIVDVCGAYINRPKWISVRKRKPDEELEMFKKENGPYCGMSIPVIVYCKSWMFPNIAYYDGRSFYDQKSGHRVTNVISHWMPLPKPPKTRR